MVSKVYTNYTEGKTENLEENNKKLILDEDGTVADAAAEKKDAREAEQWAETHIDDLETADADEDAGDIERTLNKLLGIAEDLREGGSDTALCPNLLITGEAGVGKTGRVVSWARRHNMNLFVVRASTMDRTDLGGAITPDATYSTVKRLASTEFDKLNRPRSILFLDELNRADRSVRGTILELINNHVVPDPRAEGNDRKLENLFFTVAAINTGFEYNVEDLDPAEIGRFVEMEAQGDPLLTAKWLEKIFKKQAEAIQEKHPEKATKYMNMIRLANKILSSKDFSFDNKASLDKLRSDSNETWNGKQLQPRDFTRAIIMSDGKKDELLAYWNSCSNNLRKPMITRILKDYQDNDDKANQALKKETKSSVFGAKKKSALDLLNSAFGD